MKPPNFVSNRSKLLSSLVTKHNDSRGKEEPLQKEKPREKEKKQEYVEESPLPLNAPSPEPWFNDMVNEHGKQVSKRRKVEESGEPTQNNVRRQLNLEFENSGAAAKPSKRPKQWQWPSEAQRKVKQNVSVECTDSNSTPEKSRTKSAVMPSATWVVTPSKSNSLQTPKKSTPIKDTENAEWIVTPVASPGCFQATFNSPSNSLLGSGDKRSANGVHISSQSHSESKSSKPWSPWVISPTPKTTGQGNAQSKFKLGIGSAKDVFSITDDMDLDEILTFSDTALTLHCGGTRVNSHAADLLIRSVAEQEEAENQRKRGTPSLVDELQLVTDNGDMTELPEEDSVDNIFNTVEPEMVTPRAPTPKKRVCLPKPSTRKRLRDPSRWLDTVRKEAKNAGEMYTSKRGKVVDAVKMKNPCACTKLCFQKITEEQRRRVFDSFYATRTHKDKWDFITRHSVSTEIKRRTTEAENSRRNSSRKYFFNVDGEKIYVCKTMFINTLSIGHGMIDSAYHHLLQGNSKLVSPDKRGKHPNRPQKIMEAERESVHRHINLYPRIPSHYTRARSQREYLEWGLSIRRMSKQYLEWCEETNVPLNARATERKYRSILCNEFNLSFFRPKKDQCHLCRIIKTGTRTEREKYKDKFVKHQENKKEARRLMKLAVDTGVKDGTVNVFSFDLQKVLPVPKSEVSVFFYKNKLSLYNLSAFDMIQKKGVCHLWHEGLAKRGANEISSCMLEYVKCCVEKGAKKLFSFSDSCAGQNKNRYFFCMMLLAAAKFNITWEHCFLEPGHTQNENDSIHARIESEAKLKEIFDVDEWVALIQNAKQEKPAYDVKIMQRKDMLDFHVLVDSHQQWKTNSTGNKVSWSKVKIVRAEPATVGVLYFKYEYSGEEMTVNTRLQAAGRPINLKTIKLTPAYPSKIPLHQKKIAHLKELCKSLAIPSKYHEFYENIMSTAQEVHSEDECGENEENSSDDDLYHIERENQGEEEEDDF